LPLNVQNVQSLCLRQMDGSTRHPRGQSFDYTNIIYLMIRREVRVVLRCVRDSKSAEGKANEGGVVEFPKGVDIV
jgi:hypothetical protein